jgi:hypothetical protein
LTATLISRFEIVGVIVALGIGHAARSASLICSVRCLKADRSLLPPTVYYVSQVLASIAAAVAYWLDGVGTVTALAITVVSGVLLWFAGGFGKDDLYSLIPRYRKTDGGPS